MPTLAPAELSRQLRLGHSPDLQRRRWIIGLSLVTVAAGQIVTLYQTGIISHLPDPPLAIFDSDKVDASDYGYKRLQMPDAPAMIVTGGITAMLAATGGQERATTLPWLPVALLGVRPATALGYEVVFEAFTAFQHSNWRLPIIIEQRLAPWLMTPRLHGIHHSVVQRETDSNFGIVLMVWDALHRTRRLDVPQQTITIGVPTYPDPAAQTVARLLKLPLEQLRPWAWPDGSVPAPHPAASPLGVLAE